MDILCRLLNDIPGMERNDKAKLDAQYKAVKLADELVYTLGKTLTREQRIRLAMSAARVPAKVSHIPHQGLTMKYTDKKALELLWRMLAELEPGTWPDELFRAARQANLTQQGDAYVSKSMFHLLKARATPKQRIQM